jgi:hypothetical protein
MLLSFHPQLYYEQQNIERSFKINTHITNKKGSKKRTEQRMFCHFLIMHS